MSRRRASQAVRCRSARTDRPSSRTGSKRAGEMPRSWRLRSPGSRRHRHACRFFGRRTFVSVFSWRCLAHSGYTQPLTRTAARRRYIFEEAGHRHRHDCPFQRNRRALLTCAQLTDRKEISRALLDIATRARRLLSAVRMHKPLLVVCVCLTAIAAGVVPAGAQRTTGEIIGKVSDDSGAVLPGVAVTLRGAAIAGTPSTVTSEAGVYRFPVLPPGTYEVEYTLAGFSTVKREGIPIAVGSTVALDIVLKISALEEAITVTGD